MFSEWLDTFFHFATNANSPAHEAFWKAINDWGGLLTLIGAIFTGAKAVWGFTNRKWRAALLSSIFAAALAFSSFYIYSALIRQKDEDAWQLARSLNLPSAYSVYIENHPQGHHIVDAKKQLADLQKPTNQATSAKTSPTSPKPVRPKLPPAKTIPIPPPDNGPEPAPPVNALKTFTLGGTTIWLLGLSTPDVNLHDGQTIMVAFGMRTCCKQEAWLRVKPIIQMEGTLYNMAFSKGCNIANLFPMPESSSPRITRRLTFHGDCLGSRLTGLRFELVSDPGFPQKIITYDLSFAEFAATAP